MVVRPTILSAAIVLALGLGAPHATAQPSPVAAPPVTGSPARAPVPAVTAPVRLTLSPKDVAVVGSGTFRVGRDLYRVAGIRLPRATASACYYERLRGREARKALARIMSNGPIVVTPTGAVTPRGARLADVTVRGRSVSQMLIAREVALPASNLRRNAWCLGGTPPRV